MNIIISETKLGDYGYYVVVETKRGKRYGVYYMDKPTIEEVKEDFRDNKTSFNHIN